MVLSADGTSLGEAFVYLRGTHAKLRLALAKDRSVMPVSCWAGGWGVAGWRLRPLPSLQAGGCHLIGGVRNAAANADCTPAPS